MKAEKWAEACPKLAESQRLDPKLGTLLNLAVCHQSEGKIATAWTEFRTVETIANRDGQSERADFAKARLAELEQLVAHVVIGGAAVAGVTVKLEGKEVSTATFGVPLALDPGEHELTASATGKKTWSSIVTVPKKRTEIRIEIPKLEDEAGAGPAPQPEPAPDTTPEPLPQPTPEPPPDDEGSDLGWLMWTGFAVGGAGLVAGAVTGGLSLAKSSDVLEQCDGDNCPRSLEGDVDSAELLANVSKVSFGIAAVGVAVGIIALVVSSDDSEDVSWTVEISPTGARLGARF